MNKKLLRNIGVPVILLGGLGLIIIQSNTALWYVSTAVAIIGFIFYGIGGGLGGSKDDDKS